MKKYLLVAFLTFLLLSCQNDKIIKDKDRIADIERMLKVQKELTSNSKTDIWGIFNEKLSDNERQAMEFMYAYMPLSDLADYPSSFFLANVKRSLEARQEFGWGNTVPEEVFLHFILPLRVNNENLDSFRIQMYPEIKSRIQGLDMKEAALEINHWCHEKVNYRGTDARTSSPLSTIKKTFGRCGEESTFTVSAMRAAGIPARQVYTPRWAHTDDNHAWVEVWLDDKWHYLGACEPEPVLNMGWFDEPSRRVMLVHTRAYGKYFGKEDIVNANERFSELNLTSNYATVKDVFVKVINADKSPADSARVEFKLYNYAEYYPIATRYTSKDGLARLKTGMGDLMIWASKDGKYAYRKLSVPETDTLFLTLNSGSKAEGYEMMDMVPPHSVKVSNTVSKDVRKINDKRLAQEDSIRNSYMSTFKDSAWSVALASQLSLPDDTVRFLIDKSYGNWDEIGTYFRKNHSKHRKYLLAFIRQVSDKDLSDTHEAVLTDHLITALGQERIPGVPEDIYVRYVLSPRIGIEFLTPWRSFIQKNLSGEMAGKVNNDVSVLTNWIRKNIRIDNHANLHSRAPLSPIGVYNLGVADRISRDIFFVAVCRSFGIPARLNPETQIPEYMNQGKWMVAGFDADAPVQPVKGSLRLSQRENPIEPQYYYHFTISRIQDGTSKTLEFEEGKKMSAFPQSIPLDTGRYVLITGNRMEDGSVLSSMTFFNIEKGKSTLVPVELRKLPGNLKSLATLDLKSINILRDGETSPLTNLIGTKNAVIMLIDPDKEPSKHVLNDLGPYVDHFNKWNGVFIVAMSKEKSHQAGVLKSYSLPANLITGVDAGDNLLNELSKAFGQQLKEKLPVVILSDNKGNAYVFSAGYKIGIGEQILKATPALASIQASFQKL